MLENEVFFFNNLMYRDKINIQKMLCPYSFVLKVVKVESWPSDTQGRIAATADADAKYLFHNSMKIVIWVYIRII